ncbi:uncharacterized protein SAMN05660284_01267 [Formivibrio citricus]|uniref:YecA family protein n=1 Tax=Formivibrio citricus TaxID=83765 RepID=A0A1I4Y8M4_9NEIS|nr:UPF0149 family protein [Formivibrio citricus]SFN34422.1 uncharacterized protein SAMN05660284_01267 [Formivibrio citricus]
MAKGFSAATLAPLTENELDDLAAFLESDAVPEECMDVSMLHGYLTALLIGPVLPEADEWLPQVWGEGGERPKFASPAEAAHIEDLIVRLFNQLSDELAAEPPAFTPLVYVDEERNLDIVQPWCYGLSLGIALREKDWEPLFGDETAEQLLAPVIDCADEMAREELEAEGEDLAQFEHEVAALLPEIIPQVRSWWLAREKPVRAPGRRR